MSDPDDKQRTDLGFGEPATGGDEASPKRRDERVRGGDDDRHLVDIHIPRAWLLGLVAALVLVLVVATVGFAVVNRPDSCGLCHVIKAEVDSYKVSSHSANGVSCQDCHTKPGVFNYFIRNLQSMTHNVEYVSGNYEKPVTSVVGVENCVQCHPKEQIEKDLVVGDIRVNHKGLREAGYQCTTCHAGIAHGDVTPYGSRAQASKMAECAKCHNGVDQPRGCSICHLNGVPPGTAQAVMDMHMTDASCRQCHSRQFCSRCHNGLEMPHPSAWKRNHGTVVNVRGAKVCASCHTDKDPKFCVRCHGLPMPHPAGWIGQHGGVGQSQPALCQKCHGRSSCIDCHGVELPHSGAFIASHFDYAAREGGVCAKCHGNGGSGPQSCYGGSCHEPGSSPGD